MVNYEEQINQSPYYYSTYNVHSYKRKVGGMLAGGLLGTLAYYIPVSKDSFVQRGFDMERNEAYEQIRSLKNIAEEVEAGKVSTKSKMILQDMGLAEDVSEITNKCTELERKYSDKVSVKNIKDKFADSFERCQNKTSAMDAQASDAYKAVRRNKFKWGVGIGAAIGLALGLLTSRD